MLGFSKGVEAIFVKQSSHFVLVAGLVALMCIVAPASNRAAAQDQPDPTPATEGPESNAPLIVPIYPRFDKEKALKSIEDLRDAYIVMDDGAVVSMADWVLGSLNKSEVGAGMSDYQTRLFLGQVARAAAGFEQDLVYRSFEDAGPPRHYVPHTPSETLQATQGILSMFIPALAPGWKPVVPEPTLANDVGVNSAGTLLFDRQFKDAMYESSRDLIESGRFQNMLKEAEKASQK